MNTQQKLIFVLLILLGSHLLGSQNTMLAKTTAVDCNASNIECKHGTISTDETWTADNVYVLDDVLTVANGATLTVNAGVVVKALYYALKVEGTLNVNGAANNRAYFVSLRDDSVGGDTNGDGAASSPRNSDWDNIQFLAGSSGTLQYVEVRHAGGSSDSGYGAIYAGGSTPLLEHVTIRDSYYAGIYLNGSNATLNHIQVINCGKGVSALASDHPVITDFSAQETEQGGLVIRGGQLTTNATWDSTEIVYILDHYLTVANGATLTIGPGVVVKAKYYALKVEGTLNVNGADGNRVYFVSLDDDSVGGDTNGDGAASSPRNSDWDNIQFLAGSSGALQYLEVRHAGGSSDSGYGAIYVEGSSPTIANCVLRDNHYKGLYIAGNSAQPKINNCDIYDNGYGVYNANGVHLIDATNNWWGSRNGPHDPSDADGSVNDNPAGQEVNDYILYTPWRTERIQPRLQVNVQALDFKATEGGNSPDDQFVQVTNAGPGVLNWAANEDIPWLSLGAANGATPATLAVSVDTTGMSAGIYSGRIVIRWGSSPVAPQESIAVTLTIVDAAAAHPVLEATPPTLSFAVRLGGDNPAPKQIVIGNSGSGSLDWTAGESISWLTLERETGTAQSTINAAVDIAGMDEGAYTGQITITGNSAGNSPQMITATLTIGCQDAHAIDVMLALDRSGSMSGNPLNRAKEAATQFVDHLDLTRDQVGMVSFADTAHLDQTLTQDGQSVKQAIEELSGGGSTNIQEALHLAQEELTSSRHLPDNRPVIVLLSDGEPTAGGDPIAQAAQIKAHGTRIITIGLGSVDEATMKSIASFSGDYYYAPSIDDLDAIYGKIAVTAGCDFLSKTYLPVVLSH